MCPPVPQGRDGFSSQVGSLRDKVSSLARELAETQDADQASSARVAELEGSVSRLESDAADAQRAWQHEKLLLRQVRSVRAHCRGCGAWLRKAWRVCTPACGAG